MDCARIEEKLKVFCFLASALPPGAFKFPKFQGRVLYLRNEWDSGWAFPFCLLSSCLDAWSMQIRCIFQDSLEKLKVGAGNEHSHSLNICGRLYIVCDNGCSSVLQGKILLTLKRGGVFEYGLDFVNKLSITNEDRETKFCVSLSWWFRAPTTIFSGHQMKFTRSWPWT